jgi:hypothetical protein
VKPLPKTRPSPMIGPRLPVLICSYGETFRVRVRVGRTYVERYVSKDVPHALDAALAARTTLLDAAARLRKPALSNTGISGISETFKWNKTRFVRGFSTSATIGGRQVVRFIRFNRSRTREQAFEIARNLRAAWTGKTLEALTPETSL